MKKYVGILMSVIILLGSMLPLSVKAAAASAPLYAVTYQHMDIYKNSIGNTECQAIVQIQNTSASNIYLDSTHSQFDILDAAGVIAASVDYISCDPEVVRPGEFGYFYFNMGTDLNAGVDPAKTYLLNPILGVYKAVSVDDTRYIISGDKITTGTFGTPDIVGMVTNNTAKDGSLVWVSYVLFDKAGIPLQAGGTTVTSLPAGQTQGFEINIWLNEKIDVSKIGAYTLCSEPFKFQYDR